MYAGANISEMILAHLIIQFIYLTAQMFLVYTLVVLVFKVHCEGSLALALFITMLEGFSSLSLGILIFIWFIQICKISFIYYNLQVSYYPACFRI